MTQKELAKKANLGNVHINKVLNGKAGVSLEAIDFIADALGCRPWELMYEEPSKVMLAGAPEPKQVDAVNFAESARLSDAAFVLWAFERAEPEIRALALAILTDDRSFLAKYPGMSDIFESGLKEL